MVEQANRAFGLTKTAPSLLNMYINITDIQARVLRQGTSRLNFWVGEKCERLVGSDMANEGKAAAAKLQITHMRMLQRLRATVGWMQLRVLSAAQKSTSTLSCAFRPKYSSIISTCSKALWTLTPPHLYVWGTRTQSRIVSLFVPLLVGSEIVTFTGRNMSRKILPAKLHRAVWLLSMKFGNMVLAAVFVQQQQHTLTLYI